MDRWTSALLVPVEGKGRIVHLSIEEQRRTVAILNTLDGWAETFHPCAPPCRTIPGWHGLVDRYGANRDRPRNDRATRLANAAGWHGLGFVLLGPVLFTGCHATFRSCSYADVPCDLVDTARDMAMLDRSPLADDEDTGEHTPKGKHR